jgi:hypothetical protein
MSCLSDYSSVYKQVAEYMVDSRENRSRGDYYLMQALNVITNLTSNSPSGSEIAVYLFHTIYDAYLYVYRFPRTYTRLLVAIHKMNDYVTDVCGGDLTDFVNDIVWDGECVPDMWEELCKEAGANTDGWNKCNIT